MLTLLQPQNIVLREKSENTPGVLILLVSVNLGQTLGLCTYFRKYW